MKRKSNFFGEQFYKYPINIHPLIALLSSSLIFLVGAFTHSFNLWILLVFIIIIYLFFGFSKIILRFFIHFIFVSGFFFIVYYLYTFDINTSLIHMFKIQLIFISIIPSLSFKTKELITVLKQLKVPNQVILGIQIIYKFIPVLKKELKNINKARKVRSINFNIKNIYRAFIIPFLYKLSIISDNISLSIETKGFTLDKPKSIYYKIKLDMGSVLFLISILFIITYYLIYLKDVIL